MNYLLAILFFAVAAPVPADEAFAAAWVRLLRSGGSADAGVAFALLYGHGVRIRFAEGFRRLPRDARFDGEGVPYFLPLDGMSDRELFEAVRSGPDHLSVPAMRILAFLHWHGRGCERNRAAARSLWRRSAELGDPVSLALLGRMDYPDSGIFRERAERLFRSLKRAHGSFRLYHPELVFGYEKDALRLEPEEAVSAFLLHAVDVWRKTGHVKISMPEEE